MKSYKNKSLSDAVSTVGSMLLFVLFAGGMLLMIAVAAGTYSRISSGFDRTFGLTASLRYVSNKLKSAESAEIIEDGRGLAIVSGGMLDVIYFRDGGLYEKSAAAGAVPEAEGGDRIFELNGMSVSDIGGMYRITAVLGSEESFTLIRKE